MIGGGYGVEQDLARVMATAVEDLAVFNLGLANVRLRRTSRTTSEASHAATLTLVSVCPFRKAKTHMPSI